jgi:hypothetical protein
MTAQRMKHSKQRTVIFPLPLSAELDAWAREEDRSVSYLLRRLAQHAIAKRKRTSRRSPGERQECAA